MKNLYRAMKLGLMTTAALLVAAAAFVLGCCILIRASISLVAYAGWVGVLIITLIVVFVVFTTIIYRNLKLGREWNYSG